MKTQQQVMKPQDVLLLLKIVSLNESKWNQNAIARDLCISQSEVSEAIKRMKTAGLLDVKGKKVIRFAFFNFLQYAVKYVFPVMPGSLVRGIATSHSASPLKQEIVSEESYVWPYAKGNERGQAISPLYPSVVEAVQKDKKLYELLVLVDALRVGKVREREMALSILKERIIDGK
jgi:DNA-binding Lrp family transcriptional regulator